MCGVTEAVIAATAMAAIGGGVSAYGQYQAGKAENAAAKYNANMSELQAQDALRRGQEQEAAHARKISQMKAQQRAAMAGGGLDLTAATPMEIFEQTAEWGERDMQTIRYNSELEAWQNRSQGSLFRAQGSNAKRVGTTMAGGSLLNGSANTLFNYGGVMGGEYGIENMNGQGSRWRPSISVPSRKPMK